MTEAQLLARIEALEKALRWVRDHIENREPGSLVAKRLGDLLAAGETQLVVRKDAELPALKPGSLIPVAQPAGNPQEFIAAYILAFQKRYGHRPELDKKTIGQMATWVRGYPGGIQRACELIQVYLQMDDKWFTTKFHDFTTFTSNLNKVAHARDTGSEDANTINWDKVFKS